MPSISEGVLIPCIHSGLNSDPVTSSMTEPYKIIFSHFVDVTFIFIAPVYYLLCIQSSMHSTYITQRHSHILVNIHVTLSIGTQSIGIWMG